METIIWENFAQITPNSLLMLKIYIVKFKMLEKATYLKLNWLTQE